VSSSRDLNNFCTETPFFWFFCGAKKGKAPQKNRPAREPLLTLAVELEDASVRVPIPDEPGKGFAAADCRGLSATGTG
jgi:hypothetical protein